VFIVYMYLLMANFPERDPFGSYIDTDVCVCTVQVGKYDCDLVREESDRCLLLLLLLLLSSSSLLLLLLLLLLQQCVDV
jgi:hypothetical protein